MVISPRVMLLAAEILAGIVVAGVLFVLIKRCVRWYLMRTLERRVGHVRKILEKHRESRYEKVDRLLFQLGDAHDREAVEIALHQVLEEQGDRFGPRLRKIYDNLGLVEHYMERLAGSRRWLERAEAARALGQLQVVEAIPELVARMRDSHEDVKTVKQASAQALSRMQAGEAIPLLLEELADPDDWASPHIAEQLLSFGDDAREHLVATLTESESTNARLWAAQILGRLGDRSTTTALVERLADRSDQVRISVTEALGRLKDRRAIPELTRVALRDPVPMVRAEAAKALGEVGDRSVMAELVQMMSSGDYWTRLRAVEAIEKLKPEDTTALEQALDDESRVVRGEAARALERLGVLERRLAELTRLDDDEVGPTLGSLVRFGRAGAIESILRTAGSAEPRVRTRVCSVLGRVGDLYALPAVAAMLTDVDWTVRAGAATAVGLLGPEDAVERLVPSLTDPVEKVRIAAIGGIRNMRPSDLGEHLQALIQLFETGGAEARRSVLGSVESAPTGAIRPLLLQALEDPDSDVRYQAVVEAGRRGDADCTQELAQRLGDPDQRIRMEAARALGREASAQGIEALVESLSTPDREFREILTDLLAPLGVEAVHRLIGDPEDPNRRLALVWTLGKTGEPQALNLLRRLADDGDPDVRAAVAGALGKIDAPESVEILAVLVNDPGPRVRAAAANGLGQQGAVQMLPVLLERTDEPSRFVLGRLAIALGLLGVEEAMPGLARIENRLSEPGEAGLVYVGYGLTGIREGLDRALQALSDPEREPSIRQALEGERDEIADRFKQNLNLDGVVELRDLNSEKLRARYLQQLASSRDHCRRADAIRSLQAIGAGEGTGVLLKTVAADPSPLVRRTALECLAPSYRDERVQGILRQALRDPVGEVRVAAVSGLAAAEDAANNMPLLNCGALGEEAVVEAVLDALTAANQGRVQAFMDELRSREDRAVLVLGAGVLGRIGDPAAQDLLAEWLLDRTPELRSSVIRALGRIGTRQAGELMAACVDDPVVEVRVALATAAGVNPVVLGRECLERLSRDPAVPVRGALAIHMAGRQDTHAVEVLDGLTSDPEPEVRVHGFVGLMAAGTSPTLERFLSRLEGQPPVVVRELRALPEDHKALAGLREKVVEDIDSATRSAALKILAALERATLETVLSAMSDPDPAVRIEAVEVAPQVDGPGIEAALRRLLNDPVPEVRQKVRRGKLRIFKKQDGVE